MANRQIYQLDPRTISTTDYFPTQDAYGLQEAGNNTIQDIINLVPTTDTSGLVTTGSFNSWTGSAGSRFRGTAAEASYVALQGQGITVNGLSITASVRAVNGKFPSANGNIQVALSATITGNTASLAVSSSGAVTSSLADGLIWIVSNDGNPQNNGLVYIFSSGSVGTWYPIAPLSAPAIEAAYLRLDGTNGPLQGSIGAGGFNITGASILSATRLTGSLASSYIDGPQGTNSVLSSSYAVSASQAASASYLIGGVSAFPYTGNAQITGSLYVSASGGARGAIAIARPYLLGEKPDNYISQGTLQESTSNLPGVVYDRNIPGGYQLYNIYPNQVSGGRSKLRMWPLQDNLFNDITPNWLGPITVAIDRSAPSIVELSGSNSDSINGEGGIELRAGDFVTLYGSANGWTIVSKGKYGETSISSGGTSARQSITGSLIVSSSLTVNGSINILSGSFSGSVVSNVGDTYTSTAAVTKVVSLTAAEYSGITPNANTLYVVI